MLLSLCAFKLPWGVYALENTNVDWALHKINLLLLLLSGKGMFISTDMWTRCEIARY